MVYIFGSICYGSLLIDIVLVDKANELFKTTLAVKLQYELVIASLVADPQMSPTTL